MYLTKYHRKFLKYFYPNKVIAYHQLQKKFKKFITPEFVEQLENNNYLERLGDSFNNYGEPIAINDFTTFKLCNLGMHEVENGQWFNLQFVLLQIVLPIVIAIITTLITIFLSA